MSPMSNKRLKSNSSSRYGNHFSKKSRASNRVSMYKRQGSGHEHISNRARMFDDEENKNDPNPEQPKFGSVELPPLEDN